MYFSFFIDTRKKYVYVFIVLCFKYSIQTSIIAGLIKLDVQFQIGTKKIII